MSQDNLNLLLKWLDADLDKAAEKYNRIHRKLIVFSMIYSPDLCYGMLVSHTEVTV